MRRVLITAGGAGIGLAMAQRFAAAGDRVLVTDIDAAALADVPPGIATQVCDVADPVGMEALFARITQEWGGLDVACANAGTKGPTAGITDMVPEEWRACIGVNLDGAMLTARGAARLMKPAGRGCLIFTSSTAGLQGMPWRAPYAAAKAAVIGLMKSVAMELGPHGIRANAICPGSVNGPRIDRVIEAEAATKGTTPDAIRQGYAAGTALRRFCDAADVADLAFYLASDQARMMTGQALALDGMTFNHDP